MERAKRGGKGGRSTVLMAPKPPAKGKWTLSQLQTHLQYAVDLELWTIPFYMSAMYSIQDPASEAYRLIKSVANQEMLHMQLAANVANAFGTNVKVRPPVYGQGIPHLNFELDHPDPTKIFKPSDSNIGPFDKPRLNTMCLVEYPDWDGKTNFDPNATEYGSIGDFYHAVTLGVMELHRHIKGNVNQVNMFQHFYPDFAHPIVVADGARGLPQVQAMINAIVTQGEGKLDKHMEESKKSQLPPWYEVLAAFVPKRYQNQADDIQPTWDHFEKFVYLKNQRLPKTYTAQAKPSAAGRKAQRRLADNFGHLCAHLQALFGGASADHFGPLMFSIGGNILSCWQNGATPRFS